MTYLHKLLKDNFPLLSSAMWYSASIDSFLNSSRLKLKLRGLSFRIQTFIINTCSQVDIFLSSLRRIHPGSRTIM